MVSFQCEACCDVVKKPKLDQHRLRCQSSFSCIDCSTTFAGPHEYKGHTSCVSEAQKYEKALYKGPKQDGQQNKPTEQRTNNGWGAGSRTYGGFQQKPYQRNGWGNTQQRGQWQQRPMGSGGNEMPLGRELRMNVTRAEGAAASGALKCAQQSEPQPTITTGGSVRAPPATGKSQNKDANKPATAERKAASKAVKVETRQQDQKRKIAKEQPGSDAKVAAEAPKASQTVNGPEVQESRNTLGDGAGPPSGSTKNEKKRKKKDVPEPIIEEKKESRKRKERDDVIVPEGSTAMNPPDLQVQKKKRKKEQGKGKEREELAVTEPMPVEAMPVRADEATKKQRRDKDGKGKERDEEKAARKARKAQRKLEKVSGSASPELDRSLALSCNVSLPHALSINA